MSKEPDHKADTAKYYDLKTEAVDALLEAQEGKAPEYSKEELEKYRKKRFSIPNWLKVLFIKAWFCGAVCFFFLWGLGTYIYGLVDMLFVLAVAMGIVNDLLVSNTIRFLAAVPGGNDGWLMFPKKCFASFFWNILYFGLILMCVYGTYNGINYCIIAITGAENTIPLGVEPVLFGLMCMGYDMLFIGMKHLAIHIWEDAKAAAGNRAG